MNEKISPLEQLELFFESFFGYSILDETTASIVFTHELPAAYPVSDLADYYKIIKSAMLYISNPIGSDKQQRFHRELYIPMRKSREITNEDLRQLVKLKYKAYLGELKRQKTIQERKIQSEINQSRTFTRTHDCIVSDLGNFSNTN